MTARRRPIQATASARAEAKSARPRRARRAYTAEDKRAAVERLRAHGIAATHRATAIPRRTLSDWAKVAGIDLGEQARDRTAKASAAVEAKAAEVKATTAERLEAVLDDQLRAYAALSRLERVAAELVLARAHQLDSHQVTAALTACRTLLEVVAKRDVVGAVGQAIDKLALLRGDTFDARVEVVFTAPRPPRRIPEVPEADQP